MSEYHEIATPSKAKEILLKHSFSFKKSLGQNFLIEPNILRRIIEIAQIDEHTDVIEVGPGISMLTGQLAKHAKQAVVFEINDRLIPVPAGTVQPYDNVAIVHQDILKTDLSTTVRETFHEELPLEVIVNLPCYVTTPIMMHFLESDLIVDKLIVMMQKEIADRISAGPGAKAYGSLSTAVQYYMETDLAFIVPKTVFVPQPNIDSAILKLTGKDIPAAGVTDEKAFFRLIEAAFQQRRKALWNSLRHSYGKDDQTKAWLVKSLEITGIDPERRGEALSLQEFATLSNAMSGNMQ